MPDAFELDGRRAGVQALLAWTGEDANFVKLLVAFDLAVVALVVKDRPFGTTTAMDGLVGGAILLLLLSALLLCWYAHRRQQTAKVIISCLPSADFIQARDLVEHSWRRNAYIYWLGFAFGMAGVVALLVWAMMPASGKQKDSTGVPAADDHQDPSKPIAVHDHTNHHRRSSWLLS